MRKFSLVAFLFATTCFVPCGPSSVEAAPHHVSGEMHGEVQSEAKGHSCHSGSAGNSLLKAAKSDDACAHCAIVQSASFQERDTLVDHTQTSIIAFSASSSDKQYFSPLYFVNKSSPPGSNRPIYILNSTFII